MNKLECNLLCLNLEESRKFDAKWNIWIGAYDAMRRNVWREAIYGLTEYSDQVRRRFNALKGKFSSGTEFYIIFKPLGNCMIFKIKYNIVILELIGQPYFDLKRNNRKKIMK